MRLAVGILIVLAVGGGVLAHRHRETTVATPAAVTSTKPQPAPAPTTSEHNWPKSSLDRANDVKRQVLAQRKQNDAN